jgi:hypothetical protein
MTAADWCLQLRKGDQISMRLDLQKIDERIKKLQEVRRLAADPEMAAILLEFVMPEDTRAEPDRTEVAGTSASAQTDEISSLVKEVVNGAEQPSGGSLWGRPRV